MVKLFMIKLIYACNYHKEKSRSSGKLKHKWWYSFDEEKSLYYKSIWKIFRISNAYFGLVRFFSYVKLGFSSIHFIL